MENKLLEIRDAATFIPALFIRLNPSNEAERYLLSRAGYGPDPAGQGDYVLLAQIDEGGGEVFSDPYAITGSRTYKVALDHVQRNWESLQSGDVVDVEFILGATSTKKISESFGRVA